MPSAPAARAPDPRLGAGPALAARDGDDGAGRLQAFRLLPLAHGFLRLAVEEAEQAEAPPGGDRR